MKGGNYRLDNMFSIHAPSRERRRADDWLSNMTLFSIHAPSRERPMTTMTTTEHTIFNPRSLTGATTLTSYLLDSNWFFNPRSLTGATYNGVLIVAVWLVFQSTLPHGSDNALKPRHGKGYRFSIHAPSRERLYYCSFGQQLLIFNPRSLTGATAKRANIITTSRFSIHAPSRERRHGLAVFGHIILFSIHAPSRERLTATNVGKKFKVFSIHAPSRERRGDSMGLNRLVILFNPRSLTGATACRRAYLQRGDFSIHAPSRERPRQSLDSAAAANFSIHAPSRERRIALTVTCDK